MDRVETTDFYKDKLREEYLATWASFKRALIRLAVAVAASAAMVLAGVPGFAKGWSCGVAVAFVVSMVRMLVVYNRRANQLVREHELALRALRSK
jgi:hypothetical protein